MLLVVVVESGLESVVGLWSYVFLLEAVKLGPATAGWVVSGFWAALVAGAFSSVRWPNGSARGRCPPPPRSR